MTEVKMSIQQKNKQKWHKNILSTFSIIFILYNSNPNSQFSIYYRATLCTWRNIIHTWSLAKFFWMSSIRQSTSLLKMLLVIP